MYKKIIFSVLCLFMLSFLNAQQKKKTYAKKPTTTSKPIPKVVQNYDDYESVYVTTGDLGCSNVVPRYDYTIDTGLLVKNHGDLDLVVKIINLEDNIASRMVYIQKNSSYEIKNIPQGRYIIKEAHGEVWKQKNVDGKCFGIFTDENAMYRQSKNVADFFVTKRIEGDYEVTNIPSYELELGIRFVKDPKQRNNSTYHTNRISSSEFNQ